MIIKVRSKITETKYKETAKNMKKTKNLLFEKTNEITFGKSNHKIKNKKAYIGDIRHKRGI